MRKSLEDLLPSGEERERVEGGGLEDANCARMLQACISRVETWQKRTSDTQRGRDPGIQRP